VAGLIRLRAADPLLAKTVRGAVAALADDPYPDASTTRLPEPTPTPYRSNPRDLLDLVHEWFDLGDLTALGLQGTWAKVIPVAVS
jgi:hypothetical protein